MEHHENPPPVEVRAEATLRMFTNCAQEVGWEEFAQDSTHGHALKPETTTNAGAAWVDEKNDDGEGSVHEVQLEDLPPPQTLAKPVDVSMRGCSGVG
jgi:hypothetical protein